MNAVQMFVLWKDSHYWGSKYKYQQFIILSKGSYPWNYGGREINLIASVSRVCIAVPNLVTTLFYSGLTLTYYMSS